MLEEETLVDFAEGRLAESERREVERHLAGCQDCLAELLLISEALSTQRLLPYAAVPPGVERATIHRVLRVQGRASSFWADMLLACKRKINTCASAAAPWWKWCFATVRGSTVVVDRDYYTTQKSFPGIDVRIEIDRTGTGRGDIRITALANPTRAANVRATLFKADREVSSFLCGDRPAVFEAVNFGRYKLLFSLNGAVKGSYFFEIKESRHDRQPIR